MKIGKLLAISIALSGSSELLDARDGDGWGWPETLITGVLLCTGAAIAGKVVHDVAEGVSTSWNHGYVTAVREQEIRLSREYGSLVDTVMYVDSKKDLARNLSGHYHSVGTVISHFDRDFSCFNNAISSLRSKLNEWRGRDDRQNMYSEGQDVLSQALSSQRRFCKANDRLQDCKCYLILYDILRCDGPALKRCEKYPYHVLLDELDKTKRELETALSDLNSCCCLDCCDRELIDKACVKLHSLRDISSRIIESAQYHQEKLDQLREQRHRELMEAQRRLEQAELARACADRELAQAERERARAERERQERDLDRLRRELRDLDDRAVVGSKYPSYDCMDVSLHIDF